MTKEVDKTCKFLQIYAEIILKTTSYSSPEFLTGSLASIEVALVKRLVYDVITAFLAHLLVKLELNNVTHEISKKNEIVLSYNKVLGV